MNQAENTAVTSDLQTNSHGSEVIPSVEIDRIIALRNTGIETFLAAVEKFREAKRYLMQAANETYLYGFEDCVKNALSWEDKPEWTVKGVSRLIDGKVWDRLMNDTGMYTLMSSKQRNEWDRQIDGPDMPEITLDNVLATFRQLNAGKTDTFEKGVIDVFRALSWDYKTNNPCRIGKRIIINSFLDVSRYAGPRFGTRGQTILDDLARPFYLLDSKNVPDHRVSDGAKFNLHYRSNGCDEVWHGDYFSVRVFKKGSAHITFNCPTLVERLNDIIARHYPGALPPRV